MKQSTEDFGILHGARYGVGRLEISGFHFLSLQYLWNHATEKEKMVTTRVMTLRACVLALHCMLCVPLLSLAFLSSF